MVKRGRLCRWGAGAVLAGSVALACSSSGGGAPEAAPAPGFVDCGIPVDRFKELMIVDDAVVGDPRASNAKTGAWSFRALIEALMPEKADKTEFLLSWIDDWANTAEVNGYKTDKESRAAAIHDLLVCPWLRRTPANGCDETCGACTAPTRTLDLAQAPFRLIGIVSRLDLHDRPDPTANGASGEGRFVFAMTDGAADDPASKPRALTMILEYRLPDTLTLHQWSDAWHHLGTHATFDESYKAELQTITDRFVTRGADAKRANGSALSQLRTNESTFNWIWQLRQFTLDGFGQLRLSTVTNTPDTTLNGSPQLHSFIMANIEAIKQDRHVVPPTLMGGSADLMYSWTIPGVDEQVRKAFARATCNGCHHGENPSIDTAFHISPYHGGVDRLSAFIHNPADPAHDELARRELKLKETLCPAPTP